MTAMFVVDRKDLRQHGWHETAAEPLADGQVRFSIDRFALTSNNITYGAFGDAMSYWDFFPTGDATTGCIPVWGFATVRESRSAGIAPSERFYGYWPIADGAVTLPTRVGSAGFVDGASHRQALHSIYNQYVRCSADPLYRPEHEALTALLRPLFTTSFLIDDFLADNGFFGAHSILVSSASSKTAYGLAFCLARRRGQAGAPLSIGLTSSTNLGFTRGLGCYDRVAAYDEIESLTADGPAVYVDMSGNAALRERVHRHWGDLLAYSCSVGGTHWQDLGGASGLPGPRPVLFFAPAQAKKRAVDWGATELQERLADAWRTFVDRVADSSRPWLRVVSAQGRDAIARTYAALVDGHARADEGYILRV